MSISYSLACSHEFELFERDFYVPIIEKTFEVNDLKVSDSDIIEFLYILEENALYKKKKYDYQSLNQLTKDLKETEIENLLNQKQVKYSLKNILNKINKMEISCNALAEIHQNASGNYGVIFDGDSNVYLFKDVRLEPQMFIRLNTKDKQQDRIHFSFADDRIISKIQYYLDSYGFNTYESCLPTEYFSGIFVDEKDALRIFNEKFKDKTLLVNKFDIVVKKIKENENLSKDELDGLNSYRNFLYNNGRYTIYV